MAGGGWQQLKSLSIITEPDSPQHLGGSALGLQAAWSRVHSQPNPRASHSPDVGEAQVRLTNSQKWGPQPLTWETAWNAVTGPGREAEGEVRGPGNTGALTGSSG